MGEGRCWTLEGARAVLQEVRARTQRAAGACEGLLAERAGLAQGSRERAALEERIQQVVERWTREMDALGVEVKGLWLVDFDNGSGYYCWKWPEPELAYFHGYDEGFAGRIRIQ